MNSAQGHTKSGPFRQLLGEIILSKKKLESKHIEYALEVQKSTKQKIGQILLQTGLITETDLAKALSEQSGIKYFNINDISPAPNPGHKLNQERCLILKILPLKKKNNQILVATSELPDEKTKNIIGKKTGLTPSFLITEKSALVGAIHNYFDLKNFCYKELLEKEIKEVVNDSNQGSDLDSLINYLLIAAIKNRATDVHIRPMTGHMDISLRIDGLIIHYVSLPSTLNRIVSAIKLKASMDISEQRLPQDGSFSISLLAQEFDIRASTIFTSFGENMVLRILPKIKADFNLDSLGFLKQDVNLIKRIFSEPSGMVLACGPTGSGKSTTLVAGLTSMDLMEKNVLSIEDPIEYSVPLVRQTQIQPEIGYDFHNAINNFLRHDPDIIIVGELREPKTLSAAMSAAITGHLVLSTLHSDTLLSSLTRLKNLGAEFPSIAEGLIAIISQRLVRCICPNCKVEYSPSPEDIDYLGKNVKKLSKGEGCARCNYTGYYGRTLIYGIMPLEEELSLLLKENASAKKIERSAKEARQRTMFEIGVKKILQGITTVMEVQRVLGRNKTL